MSILVTTSHETAKNACNNSPSKALYSFSKEKRFAVTYRTTNPNKTHAYIEGVSSLDKISPVFNKEEKP